MMDQSEKREIKRGGKISLVEFFTTLGLVVATGVLLSQDTRAREEPPKKRPHLSIYEINKLMDDFESPTAPYRAE